MSQYLPNLTITFMYIEVAFFINASQPSMLPMCKIATALIHANTQSLRMSASKVVKFLILSDTHNFENTGERCALNQPMPKVDVVLHCGDLTSVGGISMYKRALKMLGDFDAELKLVIAGNHDLSLDGEYWRNNLDEDDDPEEHKKAVEVMTGPLAKAANVTYLTEGAYSFTLQNGASFKIFASPYSVLSPGWAFGHKRGEARWNIPDDVDIVMTHGPPHGILDEVTHRTNGTVKHLGCETLLEEIRRVRPLVHCFGHIHEGNDIKLQTWDRWHEGKKLIVQTRMAGRTRDANEMPYELVRGATTLMVSAAVMTEEYRPDNPPWLVELPLK